MPLTPEVLYDSLNRHQEKVGVVDPGSLSCGQVLAGTMNEVTHVYFTSARLPRQLAVRTPRGDKPKTDEEVSTAYQQEQDLRRALPASSHPEIYYVDSEPSPHFVEEYVEGTHPSSDGRDWTDQMVETFADTMALVHNHTRQPNPDDSPECPLTKHYEWVTRSPMELARDSPAEQYLQELDGLVRAKLAGLEGNLDTSDHVVLNHSDLVAPNLIFRPDGRLVCIDWEYAGFVDPAKGLGATTSYTCKYNFPLSAVEDTEVYLDERQENLFLSRYLSATTETHAFIKRLRLWQAALYVSVLVKLSCVVYTPDAAHRWKPSEPERIKQELETALTANGLPLFDPETRRIYNRKNKEI